MAHSASSLRVPCYCARCSAHPDGFVIQTKKNNRLHMKAYPLRAPEPATSTTVNSPIPLVFDSDSEDGARLYGMSSPPRIPSQEPTVVPSNQQPPFRSSESGDTPDISFQPVVFPDTPTPGSDQDEADQPAKPFIRLAYLEACLANIYSNVTLNGALDALFIAGVLPLVPRPVRTLVSAKRRLGIDADQYITQYALCTECWKHYTPTELWDLPSPYCILPECSGEVFEQLEDSKGKIKRRPLKIMPHTSIIATLRRFFRRPGFAQMIRDSRNDVPGRNNNENFLMKDMSDGDIWHMSRTGICREIGDCGTVRDVPIEGGGRNLSSHRFGLHLTMNAGWFGMLERPHSTGPIYYCINDLPIHERFLQRNMLCSCIMPGPKEPSAQQINHCMEPSTKEIAELQNGEQYLEFILWINKDSPFVRCRDGDLW
ncbi:hypothetical protein NEOLEDRAFT_1159410 [Neolentinus lepideus HHB14362 ss-1]|uniref:Uncharacterized protein n=1 Tax=Neolentinus lepideus HHB14362 ss-1 TaxID=1314782 RepID=A0A165MP71_9AGAM|nr:hypothetical protein NEOLEDRAFT_1159410 [Neolentinus lepideus HHB14362 ss-1]